MRGVRLVYGLASMVALAMPAGGQDSARVADQTDAVRVFLDCDGRGCDREYFVEQVAFVNWVRDRADAEVHLLVTMIGTGGGGTEYSIGFLGARRFAGVRDSLRYNSVPNESQDATRSGLARLFRLGLVRFAATTSAAKQMDIRYDKPKTAAKAAIRDPWNFWTYSVSADAFGRGESSYGSLNISSGIEANRVTEQWKAQLEINSFYGETRTELTDRTFHNFQRSANGGAKVGKSFGAHLTAGAYAGAGHSDYDNERLTTILAPAIEYDVFPYAQATRRQLTFLYLIGPRFNRYQDTTLYDKLEDSLLFQQLLVGLRVKQRWGSSNVSLTGSNYPTQPDFYRLTMNGHVELQVVKGLSMRLGGRAARVNDQLYLQKGALTDEERLVRQRALATNYQYFFSAGLSYAFGSIYNTIVNPRFRNLGDF